MSNVKAPLSLRFKNSTKGFLQTFKNPWYIIIALVVSFFITGFIIWSLNFDLLRYIWFDAPINLLDKLRLMWDVHTGIYRAYSNFQATGIILFGLLFGINAALIIKMLRVGSLKQVPKKSGGAGLIFAVMGGGCVACGTSILAPLLATLGATSTVFVQDLSNFLNWISIILISYSIYKLSGVINNTNTKHES